jgi:hypothetical protein
MTEFTAKQKREAVEREIKYRRRVFPRLVANQKMSQALANEQIALFEAILADYVKLEPSERLL